MAELYLITYWSHFGNKVTNSDLHECLHVSLKTCFVHITVGCYKTHNAPYSGLQVALKAWHLKAKWLFDKPTSEVPTVLIGIHLISCLKMRRKCFFEGDIKIKTVIKHLWEVIFNSGFAQPKSANEKLVPGTSCVRRKYTPAYIQSFRICILIVLQWTEHL